VPIAPALLREAKNWRERATLHRAGAIEPI
jgi:hypothetical protein